MAFLYRNYRDREDIWDADTRGFSWIRKISAFIRVQMLWLQLHYIIILRKSSYFAHVRLAIECTENIEKTIFFLYDLYDLYGKEESDIAKLRTAV